MSEYTPLFVRDVKVPEQIDTLIRPVKTLRHVNSLMELYFSVLSDCLKKVNAQLSSEPKSSPEVQEQSSSSPRF